MARGKTATRQGQQDNVRRGVWGTRTDVDGAGSIMSVRRTGNTDLELPVINFGFSFNLSDNSNAEVLTFNLGSDPNDMVAIPVIPREFQYQWAQGTGGVQHPTDPERRVEFNDTETWLRDGKFVLGTDREVEVTVDGSNVTITCANNATILADAVEITSTSLTHNGTDVGDTHTHTGDSGGITGAPL